MNSKYKPRLQFLGIVIALLAQAALLKAGSLYVAGSPDSDTVLFASQAKLEFIEGSTHTVTGFIVFDPLNTALPASGKLRVDARTLKTGIDMRDEHMRDRHLQTDKFPYIEFTLQSVTGLPATMLPGQSYSFQVIGQFTVHGTTREVKAEAYATYAATDSANSQIVVSATFPIKLDDYGIPRPKALFLKLAETVDITVRFVAASTNPKIEF